jgi:predicted DNA-binding protein (UPF0251 family)
MSEIEQVPLLREELEALKLCDLDDLTQAEAAPGWSVKRNHSKNTHHCKEKSCESPEQRPGYRI